MIVNNDIFTPQQATALVRGSFEGTCDALPMTQLFPNKPNDGLYATWNVNARVDTTEMNFSAFDAEAPYGQTPKAAGSKTAALLPMRLRHRISEVDIINNRGNSSDWVKDKLTEYFVQLGAEAALRLERAKAEILSTGKLTVPELDKTDSYDFGRDKNLTVDVSSSGAWDDDADPVQDIKDWIQKMKDNDGIAPTTMYTTRQVMDVLATNKNIIAYATGNNPGSIPPMIGYDNVRSVLSMMLRISNVTVVDDMYDKYLLDHNLRFASGKAPVFDDGTVVLAADNVGYTALGPTAEASDSSIDFGGLDARGFVGLVQDEGNGTTTHVAYSDGLALPVLELCNSTFKAKVLA